MTEAKTIPAHGGGYYGLYFSEERGKWVKVAPINGGAFETIPEAIRAAKHRVGDPMNITAACPLPEPCPDLEALGVNVWRLRKQEAAIEFHKQAFGTVRVRGREVKVEIKGKKNGRKAT